ncbi:hypothetical protein BWI93_03140 [Siphonobacter sp. BAB-5385]|uniref:D-Ala-D-Ala carboxypeptidase family metallohydrolase n=1 Tax=Siphonobacter sp. BAB-5385 TaxID=1864822 RepID=UPI000B9EE68C|nr:D-Ala-D-Ala carboxypeptidase family metallohydrolase [Siphonobacter sp. BAB-5385]OZI09591.1 hypothetical protein BWI93_03140 [Siphonobacter sp. BAB-5385]
MKKISTFVSYKEATASATAARLGIDNTPGTETLKRMAYVADRVHTPLREHFNIPIPVTSFYRSSKLNSAIGGARSSQHVKGEAMDLDLGSGVNGVQNRDLFEYIRKYLAFDQLIWEFGTGEDPDWVHVSLVKEGNRREILKATKVNGKTTYVPYN